MGTLFNQGQKKGMRKIMIMCKEVVHIIGMIVVINES